MCKKILPAIHWNKFDHAVIQFDVDIQAVSIYPTLLTLQRRGVDHGEIKDVLGEH